MSLLLRLDLHGGVTEEVVDGEQLREGACLCVGFLCGEEDVTETWVLS
jgi:hypothetical protein